MQFTLQCCSALEIYSQSLRVNVGCGVGATRVTKCTRLLSPEAHGTPSGIQLQDHHVPQGSGIRCKSAMVADGISYHDCN